MIKLKSLVLESLRENAEFLHYKGRVLNYNNVINVNVVFIIYQKSNNWVLYKNEVKPGNYYPHSSNDIKGLKAIDYPPSHSEIHNQTYLIGGGKIDDYKTIAGRIWDVRENNMLIISFWNSLKEMDIHKDVLFDMLKKCGYDPKKLLYEFDDQQEVFYSYDVFKDKRGIPEPTKDHDEKERDIRKQLHTMDPYLKKQLMGILK